MSQIKEPTKRAKPWIEQEGLTLIEGWARDGLTDEQIAKNMGVARSTLNDWRKDYPDISDTLKKGKEVVDYEVENALRDAALAGNVTAQIFWLKNRRPDKWRDRVENDISGETRTVVSITNNLSDQVLPRLYPLFEDEYANVIVTSGRAGAKSSAGAIAANYRLISKPCAIIGMRKHHNKLNPTIYKESLRAIGRLGLSKSKDYKITKKPMEIRYLDNGSTMYFAGSDGADDTKGIIDENYSIELVQIDEVSEFLKWDCNKAR